MVKKQLLFRALLVGLLSGVSAWYLMRSNSSGTSVAHSLSIAPDKLKGLSNIVPVAIIGSGPAGLSAALYTSRMNAYTVLFHGKMPGGQLTGTSDVENWPGIGTKSGPNIMKDLQSHVETFGAQLVGESVEKLDLTSWPFKLVTDEGTTVNALTVIIATGSSPKRLNVSGEEAYWGRGVSTCAVCDAPFYKDRVAYVVGGGDSACEAATQLAGHAKSVIMLVRGDKMRASAIMQERVKSHPNIAVRYNTRIKEIKGDSAGVTSVDLITGDAPPVNEPTHGVFLAVGHDPNTALVKDVIKTDKLGYIELEGRSQETSMPGVFAAGDVADHKYRQAGVASGEGIKAALDAIEFLQNNGFNEVSLKKLERQFFEPAEAETVKVDEITTSAEFEAAVANEKRPIILDFYAPYCPSCMSMLPVFASVAGKLGDKVKFLKVDVSKSNELAKRFDVPMIPTMLVMQQGKLHARSTEVMNKRTLKSFVEGFLKKK